MNKYYIPITGTHNYNTNDSMDELVKNYSKYTAFVIGSCHFNNKIDLNLIPFTGECLSLDFFKDQIIKQQMIGISMGVYQYSHFLKDTTTNYIYLQIPQTGFGAFFKLYEQ